MSLLFYANRIEYSITKTTGDIMNVEVTMHAMIAILAIDTALWVIIFGGELWK